jgi:aldehyde dehydrogenase (NAD+)
MHETYERLFIGGTWRESVGGKTIVVRSPSTEEQIGEVPEASVADIDAAVAAAREAFDDKQGWAHWEPARRAEVLERLATEMEKNAEEFAQRVSAQNGMPITVSRAVDTALGGALLRYYAALAVQQSADEVRRRFDGTGDTLVRRLPIGTVGAIVPWNFPQALTFFKIAPALAAGCTVVIKPAPETVLDAFLLAEAVERAGLPPGVVNIVPAGREGGAHLVRHPGIDKIAFTGSTAVGRNIAEECARLLRPVTLELGGKSAAILLDDADLDGVLDQFFAATLLNNGQTCFLGTRILAPRSTYQATVDTLTDLLRGLRLGDALDEATQVGPLTTSGHRQRVEEYIRMGSAGGGRITTGGGRPGDQDRGWFVEPTLFADVDNSMAVAREEIFGPVLCVIPYDGVEQAIEIANDSDYGLGGTVWGSDVDRALTVARRIRTGTIGINGYVLDPGSPFGGVKGSGLGRELGPEGLADYQQFNTIYLPH